MKSVPAPIAGLVKVVEPYREPFRVLERINDMVLDGFAVAPSGKGVTDEERRNPVRESDFQETVGTMGGNPSLNNLALELGNRGL